MFAKKKCEKGSLGSGQIKKERKCKKKEINTEREKHGDRLERQKVKWTQRNGQKKKI